MRFSRSVLPLCALLLVACGGSPSAPASAPHTAPTAPAADPVWVSPTGSPLGPLPSIPAAPAPSTPSAPGNGAANPPQAGSAGPYRFTLVFLPGTDPRVRAALEQAAARWQQVVTAGVGAANINLPAQACGNAEAYAGSVSGMVVFTGNENIDGAGGTLAKSGPCAVRTANGLTAVATLVFDSADLDQFGPQLGTVATHELGHALGIGSLWNKQGLLLGEGGQDPRYNGAAAMREYAALGGTLGTLPVENQGGSGTAGGHWRETTFGNELMTGYLDSGFNPLSRLTVAALQDLGYAVNYGAADPYTAPPTLNTLGLKPAAPLGRDLERGVVRPAQLWTLPAR